jgi:hypothetical protein
MAPENARRNSSFLVICPRETMELVIVVPILAPRMMGIARGTLKTPEPTQATAREVTIEELCTMLVASIPTKRPAKRLWAKAISDLANPPPASLSDRPNTLMETINRYKRMRKKIILRIKYTRFPLRLAWFKVFLAPG